MLRSLHSGILQLPWPQLLAHLPQLPQLSLLTSLHPGSSAWAAQVKRGVSYSSTASTEAAEPDVQQAARELGLDAVPLPQLRELVADALPRDTPENSIAGVNVAPPRQKRLTYSDVQGYEELLQSLLLLPEKYSQAMPKAPALDAGQWVDTHFKQAGYGFEPRSPFYVWRAWAAAALPRDQVETLLVMENVMADDNQRSALLKQAQHELARLWDWQHRRAALGLPPDLPGSSGSSSGSRASSVSAAGADVEAAAAGAKAAEAAPAVAAVTKAETEVAPTVAAAVDEASSSSNISSSSSSSDEEVSIPVEDLANKGVLELLESTGALQTSAAEEFEQPLQQEGAAAAAAAPGPLLEWMNALQDDVAPPARQQQDDMAAKLAQNAGPKDVDRVQQKLLRGQATEDKGKYRSITGFTPRTYQPVAHDDDMFLPGKPLGSAKVAAQLSDPAKAQAVDPSRVVRQAVAVLQLARASAEQAAEEDPTAAAAAAAPAPGGDPEGGTWLSMPLLDRGVLHQQKLREQQERLAARPKKQQRWQLLPLDDYSFDLDVRPHTPTFDLLTAYLEVKYADVLLRKDAVKTLQRQMAVAALTKGSTGGTASEVLEAPPAALTAAKTLSPAEREGVIQALDDLLGSKQYGQYKEAVLQLYCDGLVSWGELQQCWAAAQAGEELTAAAEAPVTFTDDRQQLFALLSGQQQLGSLISSTAAAAAAPKLTAADEAAARKAWEEAGQKLAAGGWVAAAAKAASASSSSSSSVAWLEPVRFEEAQQTWQQLLQLVGMPEGPRLEQVLLAGSSSSSSSAVEQEQLQQQLQRLQQALQQTTGLSTSAAAVGAGAVAVDDFEQLQQLCAAAPSLEEVLQEHWEQVSVKHLGNAGKWQGPTWQQLWQLLQALSQRQQRRHPAAADAPAAADVTALFDQYLREAEAVPLTPPPYPGARRLLQWEQRIVLGARSGQVTTSTEVKVKLRVSAAELQQETGLSKKGLQHLLAVAGSRYNPATGILSLSCDRFPTREENRRWCLEVLHRLLQEGQACYPSPSFLLGPAAARQAATAAAS